MRKLLILSVVAIMAAGAAGCNTCGSPCGSTCGSTCGRSPCGWLTSWRPRTSCQHQDCCAPAQSACCNSCGGGSMGAGMIDGIPSGSMMMPAQSSCCQ